jgi:hypothetical protein
LLDPLQAFAFGRLDPKAALPAELRCGIRGQEFIVDGGLQARAERRLDVPD